MRNGRHRWALLLSVVSMLAVSGCGASGTGSGRPSDSPEGAAAGLSNRYALVGVSSPSEIERVDLQTGKVLSTIPLDGGIPWSIAIAPNGHTAYVTESSWPSANAPNDVVPIDLRDDSVGAPIRVGLGPVAIGIDVHRSTAYVVNMGTTRLDHGTSVVVDDFSVTPVNLDTGRPSAPIRVCPGPGAIAMTKDMSSALIACTGTPSAPSYDVVPIDLETRRTLSPIKVGVAPMAIAITPDGKTAFVANTGWPQDPDSTVTPVDMATRTAGRPIPVGASPISIAITPDGKTAFVVNNGYAQGRQFTVTPVDVATDTPAPAIPVGAGPVSVTISPDGRTAYVPNMGATYVEGGATTVETGDTISVIDVATRTVSRAIHVGTAPTEVVMLPKSAVR